MQNFFSIKGVILQASCLFILQFPVIALAHHGKDFLQTSTCKTPELRELLFFLSAELFQDHEHGNSYGLEPGILYGLFDKGSAEIHTHHQILDKGHTLESIGLELRYRFFGSKGLHNEGLQHRDYCTSPFSIAGLIEYQKSMDGSPNAVEGRVIIGKEIFPISMMVNLVAEKTLESNSSVETGYAVGTRYEFMNGLAAGIEFNGTFDSILNATITPGIYTSFSNSFHFRLGTSFPTGGEEKGVMVLSTFIYSP